MWGVLATSLFFLPFNRLIAWLVLAVSAAMGLYHGVLTPLSLAYLLGISVLTALCHYYRDKLSMRVLLEILLVVTAVTLFLHLIPGFNNLKAVDADKAGPLSAPFTMYYNFDKALVPFLLFACLPTLFKVDKTDKTVRSGYWVALIVSVPTLLLLGVALGGLKIEPHLPWWILPFLMANLFFVCLAEEALFRGYLQQRLSQWLGAWPALIIAAVIFGAAHLPGGMLMVVFATLAGLIYGLAWMWSGRLWVPILFHFGLNLTHVLFFTYPLYLHP